MASISPFEFDEQTDDDFFDKLVADDDNGGDVGVVSSLKVSELVKGGDGLDSDEFDEVKSFANLSLSEVGNRSGDRVISSVGEVDNESGDCVISSVGEVDNGSVDLVISSVSEVNGSGNRVNSSVGEVDNGGGDHVDSSVDGVDNGSGDRMNSSVGEVDNGHGDCELREGKGSDGNGGADVCVEARGRGIVDGKESSSLVYSDSYSFDNGLVMKDGAVISSLASSESFSFDNGLAMEDGVVSSKVKFGLRRESSEPPSGGVKEAEVSDGEVSSSLTYSGSFSFDNGQVVEDGVLSSADGEANSSLASSESFSFGNEQVFDGGVASSEVKSGLGGQSSRSPSGVVKEAQWSAFGNSSEIGSGGFESYDDFFTDLGQGDKANGQSEDTVFADEDSMNPVGGGSYNLVEQTASAVDTNSVEYYESQYPGWKYDRNTGQWYQLDINGRTTIGQENVEAACGNALEAFDTSVEGNRVVSDVRSFQVSYSQPSTQSVVGNATEKSSTTENASGWNHNSEQNGEYQYPAHMVFDPQYPGWYYDTVVQEWCSLDAYHSLIQSTALTDNLQVENRTFGATNSLGSSHDLNGNGLQIPSNEGVGVNQSWATTFGHYTGQGFSNGKSASGVQNGPAASYSAHQSWPTSHDSNIYSNGQMSPQNFFDSPGIVPSYGRSEQELLDSSNWANGVHSSVPSDNAFQQYNHSSAVQQYDHSLPVQQYNHSSSVQQYNHSPVQQYNHSLPLQHYNNSSPVQQCEPVHYHNDFYNSQNTSTVSQPLFSSGHHTLSAPDAGRSSAGHPPHALVTFGFGGKLVVMKDTSTAGFSMYGTKDVEGCSLSVLNLMEIVGVNNDSSSNGAHVSSYFHSLGQQSFPGPLVGGSAGSKEVNKWIDEKIATSELMGNTDGKGDGTKLLLSLLKIAFQHYGKLRSFSTEGGLKENGLPESAVARLFASAKRNNEHFNQYCARKCLMTLPSEHQIQVTASEVQTLLISGRKMEALQRAQVGQFWEFALILARQLGDQFYHDTVKKMAVSQLVAGSPLRTLCLLIGKKPEEVFSHTVVPAGNLPGSPTQPVQGSGYSMLDNWEENLAVMTANRTENDHLVITHLGDCLWKDHSYVSAAHICYLVAEADFELYSDTARLCLIGADHWNLPRTFASPEAIQRTELFEYAKVLGNSQFVLLPLQPYKLIYAHMLAEVGKVSDSLKYCQAVYKTLKTARSPEADTLRQLLSALEERNRTHQQSGYAANLAPAKIVGKLLNFFDNTAHRVVGGLPAPVPAEPNGFSSNDHHFQTPGTKAKNSQSTPTMSPIMPSASMEAINQWAVTGSKILPQNRSSSESDIGRSPRMDQVDNSSEVTPSSSDGKKSGSTGASRFGFNFSSQIFQKTVGLVLKPRQGHQAKLGDTNKFYYDEKLKRWVEEGAESPAEESAMPPPPTTAVLQNHQSDCNSIIGLSATGRSPDPASSSPPSFGIPAIPPSSNQFTARGHMGVRSRYVDTFNKGGTVPKKSFQAPSIPSVKAANLPSAKFFVPTAVSPSDQTICGESESIDDVYGSREQSSSSSVNEPFQNLAPLPVGTMQRFPSVDNIPNNGAIAGNNFAASQTRRTASWSAIHSDTYTPPPTSMPSNQSSGSVHSNGGSFGDDLQEVKL